LESNTTKKGEAVLQENHGSAFSKQNNYSTTTEEGELYKLVLQHIMFPAEFLIAEIYSNLAFTGFNK